MSGISVGLLGFYSRDNFGDDLMEDVFRDLLSYTGDCHVQVYSDVEGHEVENGYATEGHLECDILVIGGGGIISPKFWAFRNGGLEKIRATGKPVVFLNVNVTEDSLESPDFAAALRGLNARWWVRDHNSVTRLSEVGIEATYLPDVSFRSCVVPPRYVVPGRKQLVVLLNSYVFNDMNQYGADVERFLTAHRNAHVIARFADWMTTYGWKIRFLAAQTATEVDDRIPSCYVFSLMRHKSSATWGAIPMCWSNIVQAIASSDLVISMRYHGSTVALAAGVPLVDITHHPKNGSLLSDLGLQSISAMYNSLTQESLVSAAQNAEYLLPNLPTLAEFRADAQTRWNLFDNEWAQFISSVESSRHV